MIFSPVSVIQFSFWKFSTIVWSVKDKTGPKMMHCIFNSMQMMFQKLSLEKMKTFFQIHPHIYLFFQHAAHGQLIIYLVVSLVHLDCYKIFVKFVSLPHLLWHGASIYNGHLRGSMTLTPVDEHLAVELSLPVFYGLGLSQLGFEHPTFRMQGQRSNPLRHLRG